MGTASLANAGGTKTIIDVAGFLVPQGDYSFEDAPPDTVTNFQTLLAASPVVAPQDGTIGGVDVFDNAGTNLGRVFVNTQQIRVAMKGKRWAPQKLDNALGTLLMQDGFELAATCDAIGAGLEARPKQFALTFSIAGAT